MNTQYNVEEWAAETTSGRQVFNYNYRMLGAEIRGWKLAKTVTMRESPEATERVYLWQSRSDPEREMVRVSITERSSWRSAQDSLAEQLHNSMRPDIPRGTRQLASVGDVNFIGREPYTDIPAAISFARGNLSVSVSSAGETHVDVSEIAMALDQALSAPPTERELERGKAEAKPIRARVSAGEAYVLIESLPEAAPDGGWLKILAPDGELSREGNALIYVSPESGEKRVDTFLVPGK
jgi:hypothetical protein